MHFLSLVAQFLLRMRNASEKSCRDNQNTFNNFLFFENGAVYAIMWQNTVQQDRPPMTMWSVCMACWITKPTNTHLEYVILIAFPLQQWLQERSMLRYTYIAWLVLYKRMPTWNCTLTLILTYSMVHSPSWEANRFAASQEIPRISQNPKVHFRTHKRPPPVSILGQPNPVHIPTSHLLEIHTNIIHPSTPRSPQWSLSLRFPHQDPIHPPLLTHTRHISVKYLRNVTRQNLKTIQE